MASKQAGNAIIIILIAVFLFGALAATFMRGSRTGQGNLTAHQAKLKAQEILMNAQSMEKAVSRLRRNGCSENQLNFYSSDAATSWSYMANPSAPPDQSCDIFHVAGGNITPWIMSLDYINDTVTGHNIRVKSKWNVSGTETTKTDLVLLYSHLKPEICQALNDLSRITPNTGSTETVSVWDDVYDVYLTGGNGIGNDGGNHDGKLSGCILFNTDYYFYHVLINN